MASFAKSFGPRSSAMCSLGLNEIDATALNP